MPRWSLIVLAVVLLVASVAAFTRTEKLKLSPPVVDRPRFDRFFSPVCACRSDKDRLSFVLRHAERIDVVIVDADGARVVTIAEKLDRQPGRVSLEWNGRDSEGTVVPDGIYRVRVRLERDRRTILVPKSIHVDTRRPRARLLAPEATSLSPNGDGVDDALNVEYRQSEPGRALLLVDGKVTVRGELHPAGQWRLHWDGTRRSLPVPPGAHEVALIVVDRAGNRSRPTAAVTVRVS